MMVEGWGALLAGVLDSISLRRWYLKATSEEGERGCLLYPVEEHSKQEQQVQRP